MSLQLHPMLPNALLCRRCDGVEEVPAGPMDAGFLLAVLGGLEAKHRECPPVERFTLTPKAYDSAFTAVTNGRLGNAAG